MHKMLTRSVHCRGHMDITALEISGATSADVAGLRSAFYRLLAVAFRYPAEQVLAELKSRDRSLVLLDLMGELYSAMPGTLETIELFKTAIGSNDDQAALRVEYARLFIGPFHLPAPPYESVYREGAGRRLMGESTLAVRRSYREEGLDISTMVRDLPDHIIAEMEFMGHLSERETSLRLEGKSEAETYLGKQDQFLADHLVKWIPPFTEAIGSSTREEFYRLLATLTHDFIILDHDYVRMLITAAGERGRW